MLTVGVIGAVVLALPERLGEKPPATGTISLAHPRGSDDLAAGAARVERRRSPWIRIAGSERPTGVRELIMAEDPDEYTTVGPRSVTSMSRYEPRVRNEKSHG